jgi:phenylacetate-CoA ligase
LSEFLSRIHDSVSLKVLKPWSRLQRLVRPSTRAVVREFYRGLQFRRQTLGWSEDQKQAWMLNALRATVVAAYENTDFYRDRFDEIGFDPTRAFSFEEFAQLPILTREQVQAGGARLISRSLRADQMRKDATGGSTGVPTEFWLGPAERGWSDSGMEYFFERLGVPEGSRTALLWGHHLDPGAGDSFRERYQAFVSNVRWFDCLRLSKQTLEEYHQEFQRYRPACIIAYASALAQLAEYIREKDYTPNYPTKCFVTGAEKLWPRHRALVEDTFQRPVHERYGGRDSRCLGMQLDPKGSGDFTLDWANTLVEPETTGSEGPILITKLHADAMPMIRYRVGDVGRFPKDSRPGHPTFFLHEVKGRMIDRICMPDGRWVSGMEIPHLLKDYPIREFVLWQRADYSVELQIVPQPVFDEASQRSISDILRTNLPGLDVKIVLVEEILRREANKWRPVISEVKVLNSSL